MRLEELKIILKKEDSVVFKLPNGQLVPRHFHVTEVGKIEKKFIDCGGTIRNESVINFQLWYSTDEEHRLGAQKLLDIIKLSEEKLGLKDSEIEVEYQSETIGKYSLSFENGVFQLAPKMTDCLAKDNCGIPLETVAPATQSCSTNSGCC